MVVKKTDFVQQVNILLRKVQLEGELHVPPDATGIVLFAHGSGSSSKSPRNKMIAKFLQDAGIATLLFDLLTHEEEEVDQKTRALRFNIPFLTERLLQTTDWVSNNPDTHSLTVGYFGASTGAAAALLAAADLGDSVKAVVSRGGRPDLAGQALYKVKASTLLIVGGSDFGVLELNQQAYGMLNCKKKLEIILGATHLFEEEGTLEEVGRMAALWFKEHL